MGSDAKTMDEIVDQQPSRASSDQLREFAANALMAAGTQLDAAQSAANALTETSLRGVDSHGIWRQVRLPAHPSAQALLGRFADAARRTVLLLQ